MTKQRFAYFGDRNEDGRYMIVIVEAEPDSAKGEIVDAKLCCDADQSEYLNEWLGVDRPVEPVYIRPALS